MSLTVTALSTFYDQGFWAAPRLISDPELALLCSRVDALSQIDAKSRVLERDGKTIRALHGCHLSDPLFDRLTRLPVLLEPARQILRSEVYTYQFKINTKAAFRGDVWPWHQDYIFWRNEDGMRSARAVNAMVFLDEVTEFNGPLYLMPGSHVEGCIEPTNQRHEQDDGWENDVSADLKYQLSEEQLSIFARRYGLFAPKGPAGSVVFFDPNVIHGSPSNISPSDRRMLIVTYNAVNNAPGASPRSRPDFLVGRTTTPLVSVAGDLCSKAKL
jgi:hypothetical protein